MSNPLRTPADYELFIYSLCEQFPVVRRSTVRFVRRGTTLARVAGELLFDKNEFHPAQFTGSHPRNRDHAFAGVRTRALSGERDPKGFENP